MILLPGTDYTAAGSFVSSGSAAALAKVTNLDGSTTNLIFDVHQYLDSDGSGTHSSCVTNGISGDFSPLATWLRSAGRMALLSETGGGSSDPTCLTCKISLNINHRFAVAEQLQMCVRLSHTSIKTPTSTLAISDGRLDPSQQTTFYP